MSADVDESGTARPRRSTFEEEVLPFSAELYRRARGYTLSVADAEDLVQETLLRAYRAYDRLDGQPPYLKAWLLQIMRNTWISGYRAAQRRPIETLLGCMSEDHPGAASGPGARHTHSAEEVVLRGLPDTDLTEAFSALAEPIRVTMYHVVVVGLSCREVASLMGVPRGTVMSRMHRGRLHLRRTMRDRDV